jgi:crotonobetainyl-CoA:carnitine CoA-transferase CaiB-like acyl-CoA transferase
MFNLLAGIRIIDLTTIVLGPYATQLLADFGAEVIKVEAEQGDVFRAVRPGRLDDIGTGFMNFNRNKRSVVLDLKSEAGQAKLGRWVASADVLVHNMRSSSAERLGASYEAMVQSNPSLVYCYSPGFGQRGADSDLPAYDDIIQARSGLAALNADATNAPQFVKTIACDKVVGLHLALAIQAGLIQKGKTGKGVCIEVPMLETMTSFILSEHLSGHTLIPEEGELGYDRLMSENRKPYQTLDGYLAILPYSTKHWVRFFELCGEPDWATSERVVDPVLRSQNIDVLYKKLAALAMLRTTDEWQRLLVAADIPHSTVSSLTDLLDDPHLTAASMFNTYEDARLGKIREVRSPFEVDGKLDFEVKANRPAPNLGEHDVAAFGIE